MSVLKNRPRDVKNGEREIYNGRECMRQNLLRIIRREQVRFPEKIQSVSHVD